MNALTNPGALRRFVSVHGAMLALGVALVLGLASGAAMAAPPAGTPIGNQASADYLDASGTPRTATSNLVTTIVQQVASLTLTADGARTSAPGGQVTFPHTLTNTGNGTDDFPLVLTNLVGDDFDLAGLVVYVDADGNGVPDNFTPVTSTGPLAANGVYRFVVVGSVPGTQVGGEVSQVRITATSTFDPLQTTFNTDVTTVTGNAVISVTKGISISNGPSPSGPYTYTLSYANTGNQAAADLTLSDVIPAGMAYVPGSGRWSVTGATVLTDGGLGDSQGIVPNTVIYDYGISGLGTVTAIIAQVPPGASGTLTFQVMVNPGLPPQTIDNTADYLYDDGTGVVGPFTTNIAPFTVDPSVALTFTGQTVLSATQGSTVAFSNTLTNNGNGSDVFDITVGAGTFPGGTAYALYQSDGVTPLTDTNGNGIPDTGPVAAGATYDVVLRVSLPAAATGGPFQVGKTATSWANNTVSATATDELLTIVANTVDVTNNAALPGGAGSGQGPEGAAVTTNTTNPGTTTRFTLYVNNTSAVPDNFDLAASTDNTFGSITMPAGWSVTFRDGSNAIITNTGSIAAAGNTLVYADVSVPAGAAAGVTSVYFRARSPVSGALDRKHDAVTVNAVRALTLVPNNSATVSPGGTAVYTHLLANNGNVPEGDNLGSIVTFAHSNDQPAWSSVLYWDTNGNGVLDGADGTLSDLGVVGGLAPGTSVRLFVQVFAPAGAALGTVNLTTLTATTANVSYVSAAPAPVNATDQTTVINGQLQMVKRQVLDGGCDGAPDGSYDVINITTGAIPAACIRYEITVTNVGTATVTNVVVNDATPANTTYSAANGAATTVGTITAVPAGGATGTITASVGTLAPGQSAVITFGVRIDP